VAGEYSRLVVAAQADNDQAHRQLAMDQLTIIGPFVAADMTGADTMAAAVLGRLYPEAPGIDAETKAKLDALFAEYETKAQDLIRAAQNDAR
jgi:hypothetical protein